VEAKASVSSSTSGSDVDLQLFAAMSRSGDVSTTELSPTVASRDVTDVPVQLPASTPPRSARHVDGDSPRSASQAQQPFQHSRPWEESDIDVTFHMSLVVDDSANLARVPMALTLFKFCFEEILIIFDIPHGGCNYGPTRLKGGPSTVGNFLHSDDKSKLLAEASRVLAQAAAIHSQHCKKPARTRVEIIDYESDRIYKIWRESFYLDFEPPSAAQSKWPYAFMWKNTMAYVLAVHDASNEFVFHVDDDIAVISDANTGIGTFVKTSIKEFGASGSLALSQLGLCNHIETKNLVRYKTHGAVQLFKARPPNPFVSFQLFITKQSRFRMLYPLQYWRHFTESVFTVSIKKTAMLALVVEMPGTCKSQFKHGVERTPLTKEERAKAECVAGKFSTDARPETFDLIERHGRCKFR